MHDHPPTPHNHNDAEHSETTQTYEAAPRPSPRIYVASLADYNNGRLHGEWIDATRDPAEIYTDIDAMLARSKEPDAEEFAIHDYEQFGDCRIHEYNSIDFVSHIARGIAEHGYAFAAWAAIHDSELDRLDDFAAAYLGHYNSLETYAFQVADDLGYNAEIAKLPESMQRYVAVDTATMARDLELSGDVHVAADPSGGVWLFTGHD
jgi:antirestriction protein